MSRRDLMAAGAVSVVLLAVALGVRIQRAGAPPPSADASRRPLPSAAAVPGPPPPARTIAATSDRCARRCRRTTRRLERRLRQSLRHRPDLGPLPESWLAAAPPAQRACMRALVRRVGVDLAGRYDDCRVLRSPFEVADVDTWLSCGREARRAARDAFTEGVVACGEAARLACRTRCG